MFSGFGCEVGQRPRTTLAQQFTYSCICQLFTGDRTEYSERTTIFAPHTAVIAVAVTDDGLCTERTAAQRILRGGF